MMVVGVVEIAAGVLVAFRPRIGDYFDIALRDLGLSLGALALARLAEAFPAGAAVPRPAAADRQRT
jgi:hypothetical protein